MTAAHALDASNEPAILLVDDTPQNLVAISAVLEPLGFRILTAASGDEALRHLLNEPVSLILLDVRMPGMSGIETAHHIKQRPKTQDIPIVFLTAFGEDAALVAEGISTGAVDWLTKPIDPVLLRAKVQVLVDLHERSEALQAEREELANRLDAHYATEARNLRKLADAALAINSTQALEDMLRVINDSARAVTSARSAETALDESMSGSASESPLHEMVWRAGGIALRMSAKQVEAALAAYGTIEVAPGLPALEGWLAVPLIGRTGRRLGIIQVADKDEGDFTESDEVVLVQLAQLAAVAIENAERYEIEHSVAEDLQRGLLPRTLPPVAGATVAAVYRPGGRGTQVGGDWYDVVPLDDGRVVLTVGDVMGRGARAAAIMGQLRAALHAYALHDLPASVAMRSVDMLLQDVSEGAMATAIYLVLDPRTGRVETVSAGHPPPLVVGPDHRCSFLEFDPHTPLGVLSSGVYTSAVETLLSGSVLVLYTDGLVEDRHTGLEEGLQRLAQSIDTSSDSLEHVCEQLIASMVPDDRDDDVAILAVRLTARSDEAR